MHLFLTSSPCDNDVPTGVDLPCIFFERNGFVENMRDRVAENAQLAVICADPDAYDLNDEMAQTFAREGAKVIAVDMAPLTYECENVEFYQLNVTDGEACRALRFFLFFIVENKHLAYHKVYNTHNISDRKLRNKSDCVVTQKRNRISRHIEKPYHKVNKLRC